MSDPIDLEGPSRGRRHSVLSDFIPGSLSQLPAFVDPAPNVEEILTKDVENCSTEDEEDDHSEGEDSESRRDATDVQLAFHPMGVAFGSGFSTVPLPGIDLPVPNPHDADESLRAELSLLRDNHIIPPKHARTGWRGTGFGRLYRSIFGTKVEQGKAIPHEEPSETTPLRQERHVRFDYEVIPPTPGPQEVHMQWEQAVAAHLIETTWQREVKTLVQYAVPMIATFLLHYSVTVASVLTVGRLGMDELAAVNREFSPCTLHRAFFFPSCTAHHLIRSSFSVATMTASITYYVPVQGLATCLDTLCAQAYGSGHKHLVGLQAQRMTWLLWLLMLPIAVVWWFSEPIFAALVGGGRIAELAAVYLRVLIIGMPGVAAFESCKRYVQSQGLFHATTYVLLVGAPLSFLQNWLFVFKFHWGFAGAATAMAVTHNLLPILVVLYVRFIEGSECWKGLSLKAFSNWSKLDFLPLPVSFEIILGGQVRGKMIANTGL